MKKNKKHLKLFSYCLSASVLSAFGFSLAPIITHSQQAHVTKNDNQRITLQDEKKLISQADANSSRTLGHLRKWQNNNFTGIQLTDKGFAVLTGDTNSGYAVTRTNSFGEILWTYNPQNYNLVNSNLTAGNDSTTSYNASGIKNKAVVEIQQDYQNSNVYYALLIPKIVLDQPGDYQTKATYDTLTNDPTIQASLVQIKENLNQTINPFTVTAFVNINPRTMVDNYPSTWKVANGISAFSSTDHSIWFSPDPNNSANQTMTMYGDAYLANIGNMYVEDGYVLIFGGNGSEFVEPDALSIGVFRINFGNLVQNIEVTGIPYAYVLANLTNTSYTNRPLSALSVGQDANFNYVPRMAVGGVSAYPGYNSNQSPMVFLAGSLTVGQDANAWNWGKQKNGRSTIIGLSSDANSAAPLATATANATQDLKGFGSYGDKYYANNGDGKDILSTYYTRWSNVTSNTKNNFLPLRPLTALPTEKNSIDPLTLAGFKLNLSQLITLQTSTISDVTSATPNLSYLYILDSTYYDFGINPGFVTGYSTGAPGRTESAVTSWVSGGSGQYGRPQQAWDGGLGMFTSLFGYSPKSVSNLVPYNSQRMGTDGAYNNLGYVMQVGAFIYFFNLTGYDGYSQLSIPDFNPILNVQTSNPPIDPKNLTLSSSNANISSQYYTYSLMPTSAYAYDITLGQNPAYFDNNTNQLANASPTLLANIKSWSDFAGLSVINTTDLTIASTWITNNNASIYVSNGFNSTSFTDENGQTLPTKAAEVNPLTYAGIDVHVPTGTFPDYAKKNLDLGGSFLINNGATNKTTVNNLSDDTNLATISAVLNTPNDTRYYFQNNGLGINYYFYDNNTVNVLASFTDAVNDQRKYLGVGSFITNPGEQITTRGVSTLYDVTTDNLKVLKSALIPVLFNYQQPTIFIGDNKSAEIRILLTQVNLLSQTATFTAQVKNPFNNEYVTIPGTEGQINQNANVTYQNFFGKEPTYLLAVAIAVPIVLVAIIIGLALGIGIPMSKSAKHLKKSLNLSEQKLNSLTTSVGKVFKRIIYQTKDNKLQPTKKLIPKKPPVILKPALSNQKPSTVNALKVKSEINIASNGKAKNENKAK